MRVAQSGADPSELGLRGGPVAVHDPPSFFPAFLQKGFDFLHLLGAESELAFGVADHFSDDDPTSKGVAAFEFKVPVGPLFFGDCVDFTHPSFHSGFNSEFKVHTTALIGFGVASENRSELGLPFGFDQIDELFGLRRIELTDRLERVELLLDQTSDPFSGRDFAVVQRLRVPGSCDLNGLKSDGWKGILGA